MTHRVTWVTPTPANPCPVVTSTLAGDTLVAWIVNDDSSPGTINWPSGFIQQSTTLVHGVTETQSFAVAIKVNATGSEGTLNFSDTNGRSWAGGVSAFSGRHTVTQPDVAATNNSLDTNQASPWTIAAASQTPVTPGCDIVALIGHDLITPPPTGIVTLCSGGGLTWATVADTSDGNFVNSGVAWANQAAAAAITVTGQGTSAGDSAAVAIIVVALRPAAAAASGGMLAMMGVG